MREPVKPYDDFHRNRRSKDGRTNRCKVCACATTRKHYIDNPRTPYQRRSESLRKYGLTPESYDELLASQGGGCARCGSTELLHVDHDHVTGRVRGILCIKHNTALGALGDTIEALRWWIEYLS